MSEIKSKQDSIKSTSKMSSGSSGFDYFLGLMVASGLLILTVLFAVNIFELSNVAAGTFAIVSGIFAVTTLYATSSARSNDDYVLKYDHGRGSYLAAEEKTSQLESNQVKASDKWQSKYDEEKYSNISGYNITPY